MCCDSSTSWACGHQGNFQSFECGKPFPACYGWDDRVNLLGLCDFCQLPGTCVTPSEYFQEMQFAKPVPLAMLQESSESGLEESCTEDGDDTLAWKFHDGPIRPPTTSLRRREIEPYRPRKPLPKHGLWGKPIEICRFRKNKHTGARLNCAYANWMWGWQGRLLIEHYRVAEEKLRLNRYHELCLKGAELPGEL
jgi:hypothetical protein